MRDERREIEPGAESGWDIDEVRRRMEEEEEVGGTIRSGFVGGTRGRYVHDAVMLSVLVSPGTCGKTENDEYELGKWGALNV